MKLEFDYLIAGGGSAGCALASRLCEDKSITVCIVEAGGNGNNLFIKMPAGNGFVFGNPKLDWGYKSIPQKNLNNRTIYFPRGKSLGGSSIVNGMIYMRGIPSDYDSWRQLGLNGWGYSDILPYFKKSEGSEHRNDKYHGNKGPLKIERSSNYGILEEAFIKSAVKAGHKSIDDFNGSERTGVSRLDSTVSNGVRQSSAISYLKKKPDNLTILTHQQISKLLINKTDVIGLETLKGTKVYCKREVIICQGAFGTPHLLMLSGIGPADHLIENDINPIVDLPGVGSSLADHVIASMQYSSDRNDLCHSKYQRIDKAFWLMANWLFNGKGPGGGAFWSTGLFHAFEDPQMPELEVFMTPMIVEENLNKGQYEKTPLLKKFGRNLLVRGRKVAKPGVQIDINQERPKSLGTVRLRNSDPREYPLIDPNYFSDPEDLEQLVKGVGVMREIMSQNEISQYINQEIHPWLNSNTRSEIIEAIKITAYTGHHPCSTAKMGAKNDPMAVLDENLKVRGLNGLRVCDASAMPTQITGNLYATVLAMAEKAADIILDKPPLKENL